MKTMLAILLLIAPLLATGRTALHVVDVAGEPQPLHLEVSAAGEDLDAFALRIAPRARQVTTELGAEICGAFQQQGDRYRIQFFTSGSPWGCAITFGSDGPWVGTRLTMHTHTEGGGQGFSAQDNVHRLQGYVVSARAMAKRIGNRERTVALPQ